MAEKEKNIFDWEASRIEQIEKSEKRAWRVSAMFAICFGLSIVAIILMMPLKQTLPYVIRVNQTTGEIDAMTAVKGKNVTFDEIQDKYWVSNYVRARESYDWHTIENDYLLTQELSEPTVFIPVADMYKAANAPTKLYVDKKRIVVKISSITLANTQAPVATVRFAKTIIDNSNNAELGTTNWVATVAYEYDPKYLATEQTRMLNPFGFRVTSYRIDPEVNNLGE